MIDKIDIVINENDKLLNNIPMYESFIFQLFKDIAINNDIDLSKLTQSKFSFIVSCIGDAFYKKNKELLTINNDGFMYDANKIIIAINIYKKLLYLYDMQYYDNDLCDFLGVAYDTLTKWKRGERLNPKVIDIIKMLYDIKADTHEKHMTSGKINPMAELAYLNHHFNYTNSPVSDNETKQAVASLPKLDGNLSLSDGQTDI